MSDPILPGTLCFVVRLTEQVAFLGRVVEVTTPAVWMADAYGELAWWHRVDAPWVRELFGDEPVIVKRENLKPIAGPAGGVKNSREHFTPVPPRDETRARPVRNS